MSHSQQQVAQGGAEKRQQDAQERGGGMTTTAMTLNEALAEAHEDRWVILFSPSGLVDIVILDDPRLDITVMEDRHLAQEYGLFPAMSYVLGRTVVENDDVAELRKVLSIAHEAMADTLVFHHHALSGRVKEKLSTALTAASKSLRGPSKKAL